MLRFAPHQGFAQILNWECGPEILSMRIQRGVESVKPATVRLQPRVLRVLQPLSSNSSVPRCCQEILSPLAVI